jgi:hypothetical protein
MLSIDGLPGDAGRGADRLDEPTAALCREIRALIRKGDLAGEEFYRAAGQRIKELKALHPTEWMTLVRQECGVGRSRAFELIAIADGRTTVEEVRSGYVRRKRVSRKRQAESGTSRTPEAPPLMPGGTISASSSDEAIGKFLEGLGNRAIQVLRHTPTLQTEFARLSHHNAGHHCAGEQIVTLASECRAHLQKPTPSNIETVISKLSRIRKIAIEGVKPETEGKKLDLALARRAIEQMNGAATPPPTKH